MSSKEERVKPVGSGSFFQDMGHSPEESALLSLKSYLLMQLQDAVESAIRKGKTQQRLALELSTTQPILSNIINGKLSSFTVDRLINLLLQLKRDVHICATATPGKRRAKVFAGKARQAG